MKKYIGSFLLLALCSVPLCAHTQNQKAGQTRTSSVRLDSAAMTIKLHALEERKAELMRKVAAEDARRNAQIPGASTHSLEAMNNRQDSLCLALRSQLVDVNLEIGELRPSEVSSSTLQQVMNNTNHTPNK